MVDWMDWSGLSALIFFLHNCLLINKFDKILVLLKKKKNCKKEIVIVRLCFTYRNYIKLNLPKFIFNWMAALFFWTGLIAILAMDCRLILLG